MDEETPAKDFIEVYSESAAELDFEPVNSKLKPSPESSFVCDCEEELRSACDGEPFYKEYEGKRYCVLHYKGKEKASDFEKAFQRKITTENFNFRGVWFPNDLDLSHIEFKTEVDFREATFNAEVNFSFTTFSASVSFSFTQFNEATTFTSATFNVNAYFGGAMFNANVDFGDAKFNVLASFSSTTFKTHVDFSRTVFIAYADFSKALFIGNASFSSTGFMASADFSRARFYDEVRFSSTRFGDQSSLDLQFTRVENPDCIFFHTVYLRPNWFVNADPRKFVFANVSWERELVVPLPWERKTFSIKEEIESLENRNIFSASRLLSIACRQLAINAEENHRYEEASRFRYMAMDTGRRESGKGFAFWELLWWHWAASGYGERVFRALAGLFLILMSFALLYTWVGFAQQSPNPSDGNAQTVSEDRIGYPLAWPRTFIYSLAVMSLQKPEPRPLTNTAQTLVLLETILGPVQAALLALAIRRKFMR